MNKSISAPTNETSNGWTEVKLGDLGEVNRGRSRHRPRYAPHLYGGPYPFVQTGEIRESGGRITRHTQTYSEAGLAQSRLWPAGTMCITIAANIAETAILTFPSCFPDSVVGFIADDSKCDVHFIEYMFRYLRRRIQHEATGSVQDNINLATLNRLRFLCPPLPEQRAIAGVLGALDDKIELNRRMNETLEAIAQAEFRRMMEDGEQKGWREGRLDEVLVLQRGFDLPTTARTPGPYPVLTASGPNGTHGQFMVRGPGVTTGRSGLLGKVYYVHEDFWPHNTSLWVKEFKHSTPIFAFHILRGLDFGTFNAGSAVPTLNRNHVHNLPVKIPPMEAIQDFEDAMLPLYLRMKANDEESQTLAALRDALLPKLLSGQLRITNYESRMETSLP